MRRAQDCAGGMGKGLRRQIQDGSGGGLGFRVRVSQAGFWQHPRESGCKKGSQAGIAFRAAVDRDGSYRNARGLQMTGS